MISHFYKQLRKWTYVVALDETYYELNERKGGSHDNKVIPFHKKTVIRIKFKRITERDVGDVT
jgi:hypothetical protein